MHVDAVIDGCKVSGTPEMVGIFARVSYEMKKQEADWINDLRARGIKASHPNDGWVDRKNNVLFFQYPHFNDGATSGDLVMLGWPFDEKERVVRLGAAVQHWGGMGWAFEDVQ